MNQLLLFPKPAAPAPGARHYAGLAAGLLALVVYGSLIPLDYRPLSPNEALARFADLALFAPTDVQARGDWVVSIVQYAALTFLVMGALAVDRPRRRGAEVAFLVSAAGALLALLIEFTQVYFPPRTVSWNDLVVESAGALLGVLAWLAAGQALTAWFRRLWGATGLRGLARQALPGYLALLFVVQWMPFDFVLRRGELLEKLADGRNALLPFRAVGSGALPLALKAATNIVCFLPLGLLAVLALGRGSRRRWPSALALGLAVTTAVALGKFFVWSRSCDGGDVVTGTAAVLLGWRLGLWAEARFAPVAPRLAPLPPRGGGAGGGGATNPPPPAPPPRGGRGGTRSAALAALFLAWLGTLFVLEWRPFDFTADPSAFRFEPEELPEYGLRRMSWMPLVDYYWDSKYHALDQFARKTAAFAPLGVLVALLPGRWRSRAGVAIGAALLVGAVGGVGQYFLPSHHPSVTDVLLGGLGAGLGCAAAQHVRAALRDGTAPREGPA